MQGYFQLALAPAARNTAAIAERIDAIRFIVQPPFTE